MYLMGFIPSYSSRLRFTYLVSLLTFCFFLGQFAASGQKTHKDHEEYKGHKITGSVSNYNGKMAVLAMLYGGNKYVVDSATVDNGTFTFESQYILHSGVYLVVLPPTKSLLLLIDENVPAFSFTADYNNIDATIKFTGSADNTAFYEYNTFFQTKRTELEQIKTAYTSQKNDNAKQELLARMQHLKSDVMKYQSDLVARMPGTLTGALVNCEVVVEPPVFDGSPEEIQMKKYLFQKNHFFDNINLTDDRLIRAPQNVLVDKIDHYLENLTPPQVDSIIRSVDYILQKSKPSDVAYRFFLTYLFNKYRESNKVGMDAVYVHIAEEYIAKGKAPWIEESEKMQVLEAIKYISPILIGKTAPDFTVQKEDGSNISLRSIQSPYTILIFWSPNCAHCKESMPHLNDFNTKYKDKGIQIFAVCTKVNEQEKSCWEYLDKNMMKNWINASDKTGGTSSVQTLYNVKTTPKIFVLDKNKKILVKDIAVENLEDIFKSLLAEKQ